MKTNSSYLTAVIKQRGPVDEFDKKRSETMIDQDIDRATIMLSEKVMAFQRLKPCEILEAGSRSRAMSLVYTPSENKGV